MGCLISRATGLCRAADPKVHLIKWLAHTVYYLVMLAFLPTSNAAQLYMYTDLGTLGGSSSYAIDINNNGLVIGGSQTTSGATSAVLWNGLTATELVGVGGLTGEVWAINGTGQIVGRTLPSTNTQPDIPTIWTNNIATALPLPITTTIGGGIAKAINNTGQIVGWTHNNLGRQHATFWSGTTAVDLGGFAGLPTSANGINDFGVVVGSSPGNNGFQQATLWNGNYPTLLSTQGPISNAAAINNLGQVVGDVSISFTGSNQATLWTGGVATNLNSLGGSNSFAADINNLGLVVGASQTATSPSGSTRATLWNGSIAIDLNSVISNTADLVPGSVLTYANAINDVGQIVGTVQVGLNTHAFLLTPTSTNTTPPTALTLARLSNDIYKDVPSVIDGYSSVNGQRILGSDGFAANLYQNGNQYVIAVRGTNLSNLNSATYNLLADASFLGANANPTLASNVETLATQLAQIATTIRATNPAAQITLTGHSLGGAVAQLVGQAAGIAVTSFDAPGSAALIGSLSNQLASVRGMSIPSPSSQITNYRLYGDQISLVGTQLGTTVTVGNTVVGPIVDAGLLPIGWLRNHSLSLLTSQLENACGLSTLPAGTCVTVSDGAAGLNIAGTIITGVRIASVSRSVLCAFAPTTCNDPVTAAVEFIVQSVTAATEYFFDPGPGRIYLLQVAQGSPFIRSIDLPNFGDVAGWQLYYHDELGWSLPTTLMAGNDYEFLTNVDALAFIPLDAQGNPIFNPDPFAYGMSFATAGDVRMIGTDFGVVSEPTTLLLLALGLIGFFVKRRTLYGVEFRRS